MFSCLKLYLYKRRNRHVRDLISKRENFNNRIKSEMEFLGNERKSTDKQYPHFLSVCAIMKDEGPYLKEWIEYHKLIGVDKFYLYDNESTDNTREILQPYVDSGLVEYNFISGQRQQLVAYKDCIENHKNDTHWLALIDLDEFICNPTGKCNIVKYLKNLGSKYTQVFLKWMLFGSAGHKKYEDKLVIERFKYRAKKHIHGEKAIINPRAVVIVNVHRHDVYGYTACPSIKKLRLNHYQVKSWEEFSARRRPRGTVFTFYAVGKTKYTKKFFDKNDVNEVYDKSMDNIIKLLNHQND